jgi:hypothetical protein
VGESVGTSKLRCVCVKVIDFGGAELSVGWVDFDHSGDTDCTPSRRVIVTQSSGFTQTSGRGDDYGITSAS